MKGTVTQHWNSMHEEATDFFSHGRNRIDFEIITKVKISIPFLINTISKLTTITHISQVWCHTPVTPAFWK